ncbi:MAG: N-acetylmuramoyl-L-alanine amidase [Planctomycetota bacterium]
MLSTDTLVPAPADYAARRIEAGVYPIPPYTKYLRGVKICLDPGHGGDAHKRAWKRGPTGVREAEVNLRVANYLRELLTRAGAEVRLTREDDTDLDLAARAAVANDWGADLFISLHHNAIDNKPQVNHTTVWYHGDVDTHPSNLDLARYLCQGLYDTLALPELADVPLKSDYLMYPPKATPERPEKGSGPLPPATDPTPQASQPTDTNRADAKKGPDPLPNPHGTEGGFGVLRAARVTACLTETSFFTHPPEEQRLRAPEYNLKEAYGLFLGLARYAAAGLPRVRVAEKGSGPFSSTPSTPTQAQQTIEVRRADLAKGPDPFVLVFELDDGLRPRKSWGADRQMILADTIAVRIDGQHVPHEFRNEGYRLTVPLPADLAPGPHAVEIQFHNMNKNAVLNPFWTLAITGE